MRTFFLQEHEAEKCPKFKNMLRTYWITEAEEMRGTLINFGYYTKSWKYFVSQLMFLSGLQYRLVYSVVQLSF